MSVYMFPQGMSLRHVSALSYMNDRQERVVASLTWVSFDHERCLVSINVTARHQLYLCLAQISRTGSLLLAITANLCVQQTGVVEYRDTFAVVFERSCVLKLRRVLRTLHKQERTRRVPHHPTEMILITVC
jgi:hypothetical protein